jgi:hypothetical protein
MTLISFRGTFKSFWDLAEVSAQSWYKVRTYHLVKPTFNISLLQQERTQVVCSNKEARKRSARRHTKNKLDRDVSEFYRTLQKEPSKLWYKIDSMRVGRL